MILEVKYNYSCLMANTPTSISDRLYKWSIQNVVDSNLVITDDVKGRETEFHVTIKYGLTDSQPSEKLLDTLRNFRPFTVEVGKTSFFKNGNTTGFDVLKCNIESPQLHVLNQQVCESSKFVDTYKTYHPHLTIAYVKPDSCNHLDNQQPLGQLNKFIIDTVVFSSAGDSDNDDRKKVIKLYTIDYISHFKN